MALSGLAEATVSGVGDEDALKRFAVALVERCSIDLPEYGKQLGNPRSLVTAWSHRSDPDEPVRAGGGPPGDEQRTSAEARRKRPFSRSSRHVVLTGGITCLALLAGVGIWLVQEDMDASASHRSVSAGPSDTAKDLSLERLREAQAGEKTWKIGVKRGQPGLSEEAGKRWVGVEIEYAKVIAKALRVAHYKFVGVGTDSRANALDGEHVDMFIGTYEIPKGRQKGENGAPSVLFAGPYFGTQQKVMLQRKPGSSRSDLAQIKGKSVDVRSIDDLPPSETRVCVVKGSSANTYLKKTNKFQGKGKDGKPLTSTRSDYDLCINGLDHPYDAVLTDASILQQFEKNHKTTYMIADDSFSGEERYGVDLKRDAFGLKREICKKMKDKEVVKKARHIYGKLDGESFPPEKMTECPSSPKPQRLAHTPP